jgi:SAM-dependent methyltransferase
MVKYKIVKDEINDFYRLDPIPSDEDVEKYYLEEFYSTNYKSFNNSSLKVQKSDQEFFDSRWNALYENFKDFFQELDGKSIFDIGFGFAQALIFFKNKGLDVSGIELSPEGFEYAQSQGLDVYKGGIDEFDIVNRRFDIVTLINVLEHLRNPLDVLVNIRKSLLKENGLLVIDVPNDFNDFQTVANEEYDLKKWWVCPPNHINYFSCSSLSSLVDTAGYEVVKKETSFPLEMFMLFGDVYVGNGDIGKQCHKKRVKFEQLMRKYDKKEKLNKFYEALAELDLGRNAIVYCTPKR